MTFSYLNRFLSADTIVPDPKNPQSLNRYSYVLNRPLVSIDSSGHNPICSSNGAVCSDGAYDDGIVWQPTPVYHSSYINFMGDGWTYNERQLAHQAAKDVAHRMTAEISTPQIGGSRKTIDTTVSPYDVFFRIFGSEITMHKATNWVCDAGADCIIEASGKTFLTMSDNDILSNHYLIVHEIFHLFDVGVLGNAANQTFWNDYQNVKGSTFPNRPTLNGPSEERWGFAGRNFSPWQKSRSGASGEEFADMGIGWTYGRWDTNELGALTTDGQERANFMSQHMPSWILQAIGQ